MTKSSPLDSLAGPGGSLKPEAPEAGEFAGLVRSATVRLSDAENPDNALESRFDLAYNAAHALSLAALRHAGFRASNRYIVFQALPHTLGLGSEVWRVLAKAHELRNRGEYEGDLDVDDRLVEALVVACRAVASAVKKLPPLSQGS